MIEKVSKSIWRTGNPLINSNICFTGDWGSLHIKRAFVNRVLAAGRQAKCASRSYFEIISSSNTYNLIKKSDKSILDKENKCMQDLIYFGSFCFLYLIVENEVVWVGEWQGTKWERSILILSRVAWNHTQWSERYCVTTTHWFKGNNLYMCTPHLLSL